MEERRETAEWHGDFDYLSRINLALLRAEIAAAELDIYNWLHQLKIFYRELSSIMNDKEGETEELEFLFKEGQELSDKINKQIYLNNNNKKRKTINPEIIEALEIYEVKLRKVYKDSGLQMQLQKDSRHAFG